MTRDPPHNPQKLQRFVQDLEEIGASRVPKTDRERWGDLSGDSYYLDFAGAVIEVLSLSLSPSLPTSKNNNNNNDNKLGFFLRKFQK